MAYATASDMEARYGARDLIQLTNEDPTATTIDAAWIDQALADASAQIDTYLEGRFALPLADAAVPMLNLLACDIAMYRLQALRPIHDMQDARDRYNDALKVLEGIRDGEIALGLTADTSIETAPAQGSTVLIQPRDGKVFTFGRLKTF